MPAALLVYAVLLQPKPIDIYAMGPYDRQVPRPEALLRYEIGTRITTFRDQESTLRAIAASARDRVRVIDYGKSVQGRPLRVFAIGNPKNIARLEDLRKDYLYLANPVDDSRTASLIEKTPALVWINQSIHGNEPASFESAMWLVYTLAASRSERIRKMMDQAVVVVNPVSNPDGHERFAVYYNSIAVGSADPASFEHSEPSVIHGRTNHYRFDLNRDRVAMSQEETRQEVAEFLRWHPHVYVDQHGQTDNYFFPPNPMSINVNVDRRRVNRWTDIFGRATARAFDQRGWTYFVRDTFDFYALGYTDVWATLSGAIGMTHETDGGKQLAKTRGDGTILTLRDGAEKHFISALAVIESAAENRKELLTSFTRFRKAGLSGEHAGNFQRVVMVSEDVRPLQRISEQLKRHGIRFGFATQPFTQKGATSYMGGRTEQKSFPAGSLVVDMAQAQGQLAKALLEPESDFEPEFLKSQRGRKDAVPKEERYPGPEGTEFYDVTGWSLPYLHNVDAWHSSTAPAIAVTADIPAWDAQAVAPSTVGYAIRFRDVQDALAAHDILAAGVRGMVTVKRMSVGGQAFDRGTFLFLAARNNVGYDKVIADAVRRRSSAAVALTTSYPDEGRYGPGSENTIPLRKPKFGVVFGSGSNTSRFGAPWYLMERVFRLPFTPLTSRALNGDLSDYSAIILPAGSGATASGGFREWMNRGGCAIALEGIGWAIGSNSLVDLESDEIEDLPGSVFRAEMDPRSFLSFGFPSPDKGSIPLAVPFSGGNAYRVRARGGSMIRFSDDEKTTKLLTGWGWDSTEKDLRNAVWAQQVPVGSGHAILFTQDPTDRAMYPGLEKILLAAMLIGPRN